MDSKTSKIIKGKEIFSLISTIISWTIFVLLVLCATFLVYYFIATRIYIAKGSGHEPKFSLYTIISPSMVPNINVYDVIVDVKVDKPEDIKINDVITFNSNIPEVSGNTITHRVIAINKDAEGNYYFQTKGDNNLVEDGVNVEFSNIIGKVALKIPQLGKVQSFLASKAGWLFIILIPALYVILKSIMKIVKLNKDEKSNEVPKVKEKKKILIPKEEKVPEKVDEPKELENNKSDTNIDYAFLNIDDDEDMTLPHLK